MPPLVGGGGAAAQACQPDKGYEYELT